MVGRTVPARFMICLIVPRRKKSLDMVIVLVLFAGATLALAAAAPGCLGRRKLPSC